MSVRDFKRLIRVRFSARRIDPDVLTCIVIMSILLDRNHPGVRDYMVDRAHRSKNKTLMPEILDIAKIKKKECQELEKEEREGS